MNIPNINKLGYNTVPNQNLTYANQLTVRDWNIIINSLRLQANATVDYLKQLHQWFFTETIGWCNAVNYDLSSLISATNSLNSRVNILESKVNNSNIFIESTDYIIPEEDK